LQKTGDLRIASSRASGYRSYSLDAGDEQSREVVLAAIWFFKSNLGNVAGCRQDEIGMFNAILPTVRHADNEWLKRDRAKQSRIRCFIADQSSTDGAQMSMDPPEWEVGFRAKNAKHAKRFISTADYTDQTDIPE
jgi:hypothetical protein